MACPSRKGRAKRNKKARRDKVLADAAALAGDRPRCLYCGCAVSRKVGLANADPVEMGGELTWPFTLDHIVPRANGGANDRRNLAAACGPCNAKRANMPLVEFIRRLPELRPGVVPALSIEDAERLVAGAQAVCAMRTARYGRK